MSLYIAWDAQQKSILYISDFLFFLALAFLHLWWSLVIPVIESVHIAPHQGSHLWCDEFSHLLSLIETQHNLAPIWSACDNWAVKPLSVNFGFEYVQWPTSYFTHHHHALAHRFVRKYLVLTQFSLFMQKGGH